MRGPLCPLPHLETESRQLFQGPELSIGRIQSPLSSIVLLLTSPDLYLLWNQVPSTQNIS